MSPESIMAALFVLAFVLCAVVIGTEINMYRLVTRYNAVVDDLIACQEQDMTPLLPWRNWTHAPQK